MIAQSESSEAAGNPAQTFPSWMRVMGVRVGRAHNFAKQNESWVGELVFFQNRIERNIFAVVPKLAVRNIEHDSVLDLCPLGVARQEDKLCVLIDEFFDEPWA